MNILLDMDGVLADLERAFWSRWGALGLPVTPYEDRRAFYLTDEMSPDLHERARAVMYAPGFFATLPAIPGALSGIQSLFDAGHDVRICTKPMPGHPTCPSEKMYWVRTRLGPEWQHRLIITSDKTCVRGDILVDDAPDVLGDFDPEWTHVRFTQPYNKAINAPRVEDWPDLLETFK